MFSKQDKINIIRNKKIFIVGRGPTSKFISILKKNITYISFNLKRSGCININYDQIRKYNNSLLLGSRKFGLYSILFELQKILQKQKIKKKNLFIWF